jgi:hypothetical protein
MMLAREHREVISERIAHPPPPLKMSSCRSIEKAVPIIFSFASRAGIEPSVPCLAKAKY